MPPKLVIILLSTYKYTDCQRNSKPWYYCKFLMQPGKKNKNAQGSKPMGISLLNIYQLFY